MKRSEGTNAALSNALTHEKSESSAGLLKSIVAFRTSLALRTGKTNESALIVKSFVVLSVSASSSGNSEATIAHNSTLNKATTTILPQMLREDMLDNQRAIPTPAENQSQDINSLTHEFTSHRFPKSGPSIAPESDSWPPSSSECDLPQKTRCSQKPRVKVAFLLINIFAIVRVIATSSWASWGKGMR